MSVDTRENSLVGMDHAGHSEPVMGCPMCVHPARHIIALSENGWDPSFEWDPRNPDEVARAREHFDKLYGDGMLMYKIEDGERTRLHKFEETAARVIATPQNEGG